MPIDLEDQVLTEQLWAGTTTSGIARADGHRRNGLGAKDLSKGSHRTFGSSATWNRAHQQYDGGYNPPSAAKRQNSSMGGLFDRSLNAMRSWTGGVASWMGLGSPGPKPPPRSSSAPVGAGTRRTAPVDRKRSPHVVHHQPHPSLASRQMHRDSSAGLVATPDQGTARARALRRGGSRVDGNGARNGEDSGQDWNPQQPPVAVNTVSATNPLLVAKLPPALPPPVTRELSHFERLSVEFSEWMDKAMDSAGGPDTPRLEEPNWATAITTSSKSQDNSSLTNETGGNGRFDWSQGVGDSNLSATAPPAQKPRQQAGLPSQRKQQQCQGERQQQNRSREQSPTPPRRRWIPEQREPVWSHTLPLPTPQAFKGVVGSDLDVDEPNSGWRHESTSPVRLATARAPPQRKPGSKEQGSSREAATITASTKSGSSDQMQSVMPTEEHGRSFQTGSPAFGDAGSPKKGPCVKS